MPSLPLTVRSFALGLALAGFGLGALPAFAQSANVTAFNPYNGVGAPAPATVYAQPQGGPAGGPAFNPWNPGNAPAAQAPVYVGGSYAGSPYTGSSYAPGANLPPPPPPPGPIESRLTAVPERPTGAAPSRARQPAMAAAPMPSPPPAPEPVITRATPPAPVPIPVATAAPAPPTPAPAPRAIVATPPPAVSPAPQPRAVASVAPPPPAPAAAPAAPGTALASVSFAPQSAEISGAARADLDRAAPSMKGLRQVELRAYAGGSDPTEARKVALARALSVRSYLIDQGVRGRIEVGAFASSNGGAGGERVDVLGP